MKIFVFSIIILTSIFTSVPIAKAQTVAENDKRAIVRIENPEHMLGTGFVLHDSVLGYFLVTNKHVVRSCSTGQYFDSVYVRPNIIRDGFVEAIDKRATLYLRKYGQQLFVAHNDSNVDLILIAIVYDSTSNRILNLNNYGDLLYGFDTKMVANREDMNRLSIHDGTPVELIGFSFQNADLPQFHISHYGHIALFNRRSAKIKINFPIGKCDSLISVPVTAEWIFLDITSRGGDSGGPVFAFPGRKDLWLIGLNQSGSANSELCFAHPSYYIWDLINKIRKGKK